MLIADDLLLLLLDDESGRMTNASYLDVGIGGALLVELALGDHVRAVPQDKVLGFTPKARIHTTPSAPGDPVLAEAYATVAEKERKAEDLVTRLGKRRRDVLLQRLEDAGILRREEGRVLGLFPQTRWPTVDSAHEQEVRRLLGDALVRGVTPDERTAALVALLSALGIVHKVLDREGRSSGEVKRRAKEIADGDWAAQAVKDAVQAAQAAIASAAVVAATAASTSS